MGYGLDGPRKKIYLGCEVCSTWELSLITREGKRGASDCLISGSSVSKPKARLRASKSGKLRAEGEGKNNIWPRDRLILPPISAAPSSRTIGDPMMENFLEASLSQLFQVQILYIFFLVYHRYIYSVIFVSLFHPIDSDRCR